MMNILGTKGMARAMVITEESDQYYHGSRHHHGHLQRQSYRSTSRSRSPRHQDTITNSNVQSNHRVSFQPPTSQQNQAQLSLMDSINVFLGSTDGS